jgi:hypothetical protein
MFCIIEGRSSTSERIGHVQAVHGDRCLRFARSRRRTASASGTFLIEKLTGIMAPDGATMDLCGHGVYESWGYGRAFRGLVQLNHLFHDLTITLSPIPDLRRLVSRDARE